MSAAESTATHPPQTAWPDPAVRLIASGAALLLFAAATMTQADSDLWGHVRFGLDLLRSRHLTSIDPYSFTQDLPWINHEWLSELQMGLAYAAAGSTGLVLLKGALVFSALFLVWSSLRRLDLSARIMLFGIVALSTVPLTRTLRPQLWSMVCLAILSRVLASERGRGRRALPVLFAVWANLHGGWIVGLGVLTLWAIVDVWRTPSRRIEWAFVVSASVLATLITPYGWTLWRFLSASVGLSRQITEWQPLWTATAPNWIPWIVTTSAALWAVVRSREQRWQRAAVMAVLAYASLRVMRIWPLYVESAAILLAPVFAARWPVRRALRVRSRADAGVAIALFVMACAGAIALGRTTWRCVTVEGEWAPDPIAAAALAGAAPGRLVVFFDWGEYALWHWGPGLRVSMDGRRETIYSDRRLDEHGAILDGTPGGIETLQRWRAEYAWLPVTSVRTRQWFAAHGYRIEVQTATSFVAVRDDLPPLPPASEAAMRGRRCFPD